MRKIIRQSQVTQIIRQMKEAASPKFIQDYERKKLQTDNTPGKEAVPNEWEELMGAGLNYKHSADWRSGRKAPRRWVNYKSMYVSAAAYKGTAAYEVVLKRFACEVENVEAYLLDVKADDFEGRIYTNDVKAVMRNFPKMKNDLKRMRISCSKRSYKTV